MNQFNNKKLEKIFKKSVNVAKDNLLSFYLESDRTITSILAPHPQYNKNLKYETVTNLKKSFGRRKDKYFKKRDCWILWNK